MFINTLLSKDRVSLALFILLFFLPCMDAFSQDTPKGKDVDEGRQSLKELISSSERSAFSPTQQVSKGRLEVGENILRSEYRIDRQHSISLSGLPAEISGAFLRENFEQYGLDRDLADLEMIRDVSTNYTHHTTYQQVYDGIPVYGRFVKVNMNRRGEVTMVLNGYLPRLNTLFDGNITPRLSQADAEERAQEYLDLEIEDTGDAELMVFPGDTPRLVWRLLAWTTYPSLELEFLIDAHSGDFVGVSTTSTHSHELEIGEDAVYASHRSKAEKTHEVNQSTFLRRASGTGLVFDPDPLTSSGSDYGPPFVDNNDTDILEVNQERKLIDLIDISQGGDGLYRLEGPHVHIVGESSGGTVIYSPPSESSPDGFRYSRSNPFFESVNAYYHIDKSQRYVQSLNVGRDIQNVPVRVNPHGMAQQDNSSYFANQNYIAFGLGGVDDAEDAIVILHEYGHALLEGSAPGLLADKEGQALHEGWADYWAGSYARSLVDENQSPRQDWPFLFKWDSGDGAIWAGRELSFAGKYPDDVFCDDGSFLCDIYADGLFWASTLMEVYDQIGRSQTDRLALASHIYLSVPVSFQDAAEAMIQADVDLNNGENVDFLIDIFNEKGLVSANTFGPIVLHEPLVTTEQLGGSLPIVVEATGISSPVDQVFAVYTHPGGVTDTLVLSFDNGNTYSAQLPLPDSPGEVTYFIGVTDQLGLFVRNPSGFTTSLHRFQVGPDVEPPVITHDQLESLSLIEWPAGIRAEVVDNLGLESVHVEYYIDNPFGLRVSEGTFPLAASGQGVYSGAFPASADALLPGSTVFYRIKATDTAQAANEAFIPESGYLSFNLIIENGLFRSYDFERALPDFSATGLWELGSPEFGLRVAHSGTSLWATVPQGAYPDQAQQSTMELPPLNLGGIDEAYLVFWHWYDTEHDGNAGPDSDENAILWDGGNVKISTDDGASWEIALPEGGYNGRIASGRGNPLDNELGFGGSSYGWRKEVVPITPGGMVRVRFDFGTDTGLGTSTSGYAGWFIDDIEILTELQSDNEAPRVGSALLFDEVVSIMPGDPLPSPTLEVIDNVGVESVFVEYTLSNSGNELERSRLRLSMDSTRLDVFSGDFSFSESSLNVGDVLTYTFLASDFDGNTVTYPEDPSDAFIVEFRLIDQENILGSAVPSGLWTLEADTLVLQRRDDHSPVSGLVFGPIELPSNADEIELSIRSTFEIIGSHGGNIKVATGEATRWDVIEPVDGYNGVLRDDETVPERMRGQPVFRGIRSNPFESTFLLEEFAGNRIWIRADFAAGSELSSTENWKIEDIQIRYSTLNPEDGGFAVPRDFTLYANFPDPFSSTTTVSYTLENASPVKLEVYDMLGRRVDTLVQGDQSAGTYSLTFDASQLASGLYLLRLETNQGQKVEKMVVTK